MFDHVWGSIFDLGIIVCLRSFFCQGFVSILPARRCMWSHFVEMGSVGRWGIIIIGQFFFVPKRSTKTWSFGEYGKNGYILPHLQTIWSPKFRNISQFWCPEPWEYHFGIPRTSSCEAKVPWKDESAKRAGECCAMLCASRTSWKCGAVKKWRAVIMMNGTQRNAMRIPNPLTASR